MFRCKIGNIFKLKRLKMTLALLFVLLRCVVTLFQMFKKCSNTEIYNFIKKIIMRMSFILSPVTDFRSNTSQR